MKDKIIPIKVLTDEEINLVPVKNCSEIDPENKDTTMFINS